ncbi:MAG: 50S ribosomal protein L24 [Nanoarchaeota archaeon]|nr:50S ribosomal protein L24 [Nanoarchaeota archaeon]
MKSKFNKTWNSSKQPRKQVKFRANAPNHIRRKFMGANLDKALRTKYGIRTIQVRKGDEVKVMRGKFRGKLGKVGDVDLKNTRLQIEGLQREKKGGEKLVTWFNPSNVKIISLEGNDSRRFKRGKVKAESPKKVEDKKLKTSVKPLPKMDNKEVEKIEAKSKEAKK